MRVLLIMKVDGGALHCGFWERVLLGICFSTVQYIPKTVTSLEMLCRPFFAVYAT